MALSTSNCYMKFLATGVHNGLNLVYSTYVANIVYQYKYILTKKIRHLIYGRRDGSQFYAHTEITVNNFTERGNGGLWGWIQLGGGVDTVTGDVVDDQISCHIKS